MEFFPKKISGEREEVIGTARREWRQDTGLGLSPGEAFGEIRTPKRQGVLDWVRSYWANLTPDEKLVETMGLVPFDLPAKGAMMAVPPVLGVLKGLAVPRALVQFEKAMAKMPQELAKTYRHRFAKVIESMLREPGKEFGRLKTVEVEKQLEPIWGGSYYPGRGKVSLNPYLVDAWEKKGAIEGIVFHEVSHGRVDIPDELRTLVAGLTEKTAAKRIRSIANDMYDVLVPHNTREQIYWHIDPDEILARAISKIGRRASGSPIRELSSSKYDKFYGKQLLRTYKQALIDAETYGVARRKPNIAQWIEESRERGIIK